MKVSIAPSVVAMSAVSSIIDLPHWSIVAGVDSGGRRR
jgi:hypothetical protein